MFSVVAIFGCIYILASISDSYTNEFLTQKPTVDNMTKSENLFKEYSDEEYWEKFGKDECSKLDITLLDEDENSEELM